MGSARPVTAPQERRTRDPTERRDADRTPGRSSTTGGRGEVAGIIYAGKENEAIRMGTIVEAIVPADEFALRGASEACTDVTFRLERVVAQNAEHIMPFMWMAGVSEDVFEDALRADPSVEDFEVITDLGEKRLYVMNWVDRIDTLVRTIVEEEAILLAATGSAEAWELKFLFLEREAIRRVREHFEDAGMAFDVHRIYDQRDGELGAHGLTEKQHRALVLALERGYYDIPRGTNAKDLATELGISHQALSEQLRRAHEAVVADSIGMNASVLSETSELAQ
jgi:predicted DNA binding protein